MSSFASTIQQQKHQARLVNKLKSFREKSTLNEIREKDVFTKGSIFNKINQQTGLEDRVHERMIEVLQDRHPLTLVQRQLIDSVSPLKQVYYDNIISYEQLSLNKLRQFSVFPLMTQIFFGIMSNLIQNQTQIDPVTMQPMKMPKQNQTIIKFVKRILKDGKQLDQVFDSILKEYQEDKEAFKELRTKIIKPILQKQLEVMRQFNFSISKDQFFEVFFNKRSLRITDQQFIEDFQQDAVKRRMKQLVSMGYPEGLDFAYNHVRKMADRKREYFIKQTQNHFISNFQQISEVPDISKSIIDALQAQLVYKRKQVDKQEMSAIKTWRQQSRLGKIN